MTPLERLHGSYVHDRRVRVLSRELSQLLPRTGSILDVGCGDGMVGKQIQIANPGTLVTGIDVLIRDRVRIPVTQFDGRTIPFPDGSFDSVLFVDVLHHTVDPALLLREAIRVARQTIVIKDHTLDGFAARVSLRFMDRVANRRYNVALPHNYWSKQKWLEVFEHLGLDVRHWETQLHLYPWPADLIIGRSLHFIAKAAVSK